MLCAPDDKHFGVGTVFVMTLTHSTGTETGLEIRMPCRVAELLPEGGFESRQLAFCLHACYGAPYPAGARTPRDGYPRTFAE